MNKGTGLLHPEGPGMLPSGTCAGPLWQELWVPLLDPGTQLPRPPVWRGRPGPRLL